MGLQAVTVLESCRGYLERVANARVEPYVNCDENFDGVLSSCGTCVSCGSSPTCWYGFFFRRLHQL